MNVPQVAGGFWQHEFGAVPSSVDWCEPNYVHSAFVAETWNSASSLPLIVLGLYGLYNARRQGLAPRLVIAFLALAAIGVGSASFHATMLGAGQAADELLMIYASVVFVYCLRFRHCSEVLADAIRQQMNRWRTSLVSCCAIFTLSYFALEQNFLLFIGTFTVSTTILTFWMIHIAFFKNPRRLYRRFFWWSGGAMCVGFFLFWFPEHVLLDCHHPIQSLYLHALFHLVAAVSGYTLALWLAYHSLHVAQRGPRIERPHLIPRLRATLPPAYERPSELLASPNNPEFL